jgi:hypothetical protein
MAFSIFQEKRLSLLVGFDYRDYQNFQSNNRYFAITAEYFA